MVSLYLTTSARIPTNDSSRLWNHNHILLLHASYRWERIWSARTQTRATIYNSTIVIQF
jgi:hypothetical protein